MTAFILETSGEKGCLVLAKNGIPIASKTIPGGPELSKCLASEARIFLNGEIPDLVAVGTGPGSYTGIRVGAALAKCLAYGWRIPLIGFCSLKAFGPGPVLVDARRGGFYALIDGALSLVSPSDPSLQTLRSIFSPHPDLIQMRLQSKAVFHQTELDPAKLAAVVHQQFLEEGIGTFELTYLSCP